MMKFLSDYTLDFYKFDDSFVWCFKNRALLSKSGEMPSIENTINKTFK